jgi:hypothetical protein
MHNQLSLSYVQEDIKWQFLKMFLVNFISIPEQLNHRLSFARFNNLYLNPLQLLSVCT